MWYVLLCTIYCCILYTMLLCKVICLSRVGCLKQFAPDYSTTLSLPKWLNFCSESKPNFMGPLRVYIKAGLPGILLWVATSGWSQRNYSWGQCQLTWSFVMGANRWHWVLIGTVMCCYVLLCIRYCYVLAIAKYLILLCDMYCYVLYTAVYYILCSYVR